MLAGVSGRLVSESFAVTGLPEMSAVRDVPAHVHRAILKWHVARQSLLGPASSVRAISDVAARPLLDLLGFRIVARHEASGRAELLAEGPRTAVPITVVPWGVSLDAARRGSIHSAIATDRRWCLATNGRALRLIDAHRTWSRQHLEFDLDIVPHAQEALTLLWTLLHANALDGPDPLLDRAVAASARHGLDVCRALGDGVLDALRLVMESLSASDRRRSDPLPHLLEQSLTVLYRVLFLLFAEARGLVPVWHPVYRDRYTIDALVTTLLAGRKCRGVWQALEAISRLAHAGCRAGDLRVTPFNGRLFSPLHTPSAARRQLDDDTMGRALLAISTTGAGRAGRARIAYRDLDVEQLGAVYEHVLDYEAARESSRVTLRRTSEVRKASGTFYTPRSVTSYLVRRTLAPLVRDRTASEILNLHVVDPAMGSGAFLVSACRYLASAVEAALIRDGDWHAADVTAADRAALRRDVAERCLFGVDLNPMAVQLARLSLWLATLAADKPLTFLDHHLVAGDTLAGASFEQVAAGPPCGGRPRKHARLPLFDDSALGALGALVRDVMPARLRMALERGDDLDAVRRKESALAALNARGSAMTRWKSVFDLWCAWWFWDDGPPPTSAIFHDLGDSVILGRSSLPARVAAAWRERADAVSAARRFLHWELEFPEVFFDAQGHRLTAAGFDAVVGNPPWDMVRGDSGEAGMRDIRRADARHLLDFVRGSGMYAVDARSHVNRYHLFVERALHIARPGGRIGFVLPGGIVSDAGSAPLRRLLFDAADVDTVMGLDNRDRIFPIHRSVRFVLLTATPGRRTERIACRFGERDAEALDAIGDEGTDASAFPISVSRAFLGRVSGEDDLGIPELGSEMDLRIVEKLSATHPWLSAAEGWHAHFGRELNASDDRDAFRPATGGADARPVLEGKQIAPFRVAIDERRLELRPDVARSTRVPRLPRLAYRDVASATNRLTLIAAIVPARAVTTHTLFCLKTPLPYERQLVLCALLNSFVTNYLVRLRVQTHVTASIMSRLPVPWIAEGDRVETRIRELAQLLCESTTPVEQMQEYVDLQVLVARLYRLTTEEFTHIVGTFPLVGRDVRDRVLAGFENVR